MSANDQDQRQWQVFLVSDLYWAYLEVPLRTETQKLTNCFFGGKQYTYTCAFYGLCGHPNFFSLPMTIRFYSLIKKNRATNFIDGTKMQSQNKSEILTAINGYRTLHRKPGVKAAPDKSFFCIKKVKFLGQDISPETIQKPIAKRVKYLKNLKSLEILRDVMKVLGWPGFYGCYIKKLHVDNQIFFTICSMIRLHFTRNTNREKLKIQSVKDKILAVPSIG